MIDTSKPVRVVARNGDILKARIVSTVGPFERPIVCVCDDYWMEGKECVMTFPPEGSMKGDAFILENIPPESKVTEAAVWKTGAGTFFVNSANQSTSMIWANQIAILRITEIEGQPPKVEVV